MKRIAMVLAVSFIAYISAPIAVNAQTITSSPQIITVTATVHSRITVVINQTGSIDQIFSNSDQSTNPQFVYGTLDGKAINPTGAQLREYQQRIDNVTIKYGTLYKLPTEPFGFWQSFLKRPAVIIDK